VDFEFDEDQVAFGAAARRFLDAKLPPSRLRAIWDEGQGYAHEVWRELAGLGTAGTLVDEAHGGSGARLTDLVLVLGELGYHAVPEPAVETAVVAPLVLAGFATPALQDEWLPRIAAGDTIVAVATRPAAARVPDGAGAHVTLVRSGHEVHLVGPERVSARALAGADPSRRLAECDYRLDHSTLVTDDPAASVLIDTSGAAGTAALLVGLCDRLVALTREHLLTRQQFGRPIAEFQVLKHRLVDVAVAVEAARSLTWNAGYRVGVGDPGASMAARAAKAAAGEAASTAGAAALQLHGGIGFTWEHDLHLWLQRSMSWERSFGIARDLRALMGAELLEAR
jgi:alkylation response protein AidB-like acyl-CoA dehydrogenase